MICRGSRNFAAAVVVVSKTKKMSKNERTERNEIMIF